MSPVHLQLTSDETRALATSRGVQLAKQQHKIHQLIEENNKLKRRLELAQTVANHNYEESQQKEEVIKRLKCSHNGHEDLYSGAINALGSSLDQTKAKLEQANKLIESQHATIMMFYQQEFPGEPLPVQRRLSFSEANEPEQVKQEVEC